MKLMDLSTDKVADIICDLMPPVQSLATDEELRSLFSKLAQSKKEDLNSMAKKIMFLSESIGTFTPLLLHKHKNDVFMILAVVNQRSLLDIKNQPFRVTVQQIKSALQDNDLLELFGLQSRRGDAKSSGSASESTEEN